MPERLSKLFSDMESALADDYRISGFAEAQALVHLGKLRATVERALEVSTQRRRESFDDYQASTQNAVDRGRLVGIRPV